jgi:GTP-binding protein
MLLDKVTLKLSAGKGGDGVVRWRREKGIPYGGPAGGDGGQGGDVFLKVIRDVYALGVFRQKTEWAAKDGQSGKKRSMHGSNAEDLYLEIPLGSIVYNRDYDITYNCDVDGEIIKILKGGHGGLGNEKFKTAVNRTPEEYTKGQAGETGTFDIELQLIADVGIIGKPNAGKSSLLNALTRASAKVADYEFTTLEPNLGAYFGYVLADIPGLIEGASDGKGLGDKFLRHIKRTSMLLHLVSASEADVAETYKIIRKELGAYDMDLTKKKEIVILSRTDLVTPDEMKKKQKELEKACGQKIMTISLFDDENVKSFSDSFIKILRGEK